MSLTEEELNEKNSKNKVFEFTKNLSTKSRNQAEKIIKKIAEEFNFECRIPWKYSTYDMLHVYHSELARITYITFYTHAVFNMVAHALIDMRYTV